MEYAAPSCSKSEPGLVQWFHMPLPSPLMANSKNKRSKKQDSAGRPSKKTKTATPASEELPKALHPRPRPIKRADGNVAESDGTT